MKLRKSQLFSGSYQNVQVEIRQWSIENYNDNCWNYYLHLILSKFKDKELTETLWLPDVEMRITPTSPIRVTHDYYSNPFLSSLEMHGGITFYEKQVHDKERVIKVGCDFQHLYDDMAHWNLESVTTDMTHCIDEMLKNTQYGNNKE